MAGTYNITIEQGATYNATLTWKDRSGVPVDLSGYEGCMQIKTAVSESSGTAILQLSSSMGETYARNANAAFLSLSGSIPFTTHQVSGSIGLYIGYNITSTLNKGDYVYDLELIDSSATKTRLLQGKVKISQQVTSIEPN